MSFFTVIIPTYNRASLIMKTLDSVFAQSYRDFEIIVVDNCSTDNTEEVLSDLILGHKIRFIKHPENFERAVSRNTGMAHAKGDFVTFLDSDDLWKETLLEEVNTYIVNNANSKFLHTYYEIRDAQGKLISKPAYSKSKNTIKNICKANFLGCIGVFIHKDIYKKITFDTNPVLVGTEDYDFWLRVLPLSNNNLGVIPKYLAMMVEHDARTMNNINFFTTESRVKYLVNKIKNDPAMVKFYDGYLAYFEASQYLFLNAIAIHTCLRKQTLKYYYKAYKLAPRLFLEKDSPYRTTNTLFRLVKLRR